MSIVYEYGFVGRAIPEMCVFLDIAIAEFSPIHAECFPIKSRRKDVFIWTDLGSTVSLEIFVAMRLNFEGSGGYKIEIFSTAYPSFFIFWLSHALHPFTYSRLFQMHL